MKRVVLLFFMLFLQTSSASALGIIYWHQMQTNFQPGQTLELNYAVHGIAPDQQIRVYADGDLAQYAEVTPDTLVGGGGFKAILRLPDHLDKPGPNVIYFVATEVVAEGGGIGTAVTIRVPFIVQVPYPGRYAEAQLKVSDVNAGDPVEISIEGTNLGTEDNTLTAGLEIFADQRIASFDLGSKFTKPQEGFVFKKKIYTPTYKPGNYKVVGTVNYGSLLRLEKNFRIGSLFVDITNYTSRFMKNSLQRFEIGIESKWNDPIEDVYANVKIFNATRNLFSFKTPSEKLEGWESKTVTGFLDTRGLAPGVYDGEIALLYTSGKKSGQSTKAIKIEVREDWWNAYLLYIIIGCFALVIMAVALLIFWISFRNRKNRR